MSSVMRVIGVDPGLANCGVMVIDVTYDEYGRAKAEYVRSKTYKTCPKDGPSSERVDYLMQEILAEMSDCDLIASESQHGAFFGHTQRKTTSAQAAWVRDVLRGVKTLALVKRLPVVELAPQTWRKILTSNGNCSKKAAHIALLGRVSSMPARSSEHVRDAGAIAWTGFVKHRTEARVRHLTRKSKA